MTIGQLIQTFQKQKDRFDFETININYTDENEILWHIQLSFFCTVRDCDAILRCHYQTFKQECYEGKNYGTFDVISSDLPEDVKQKDFWPIFAQPAKKSDFKSNDITVRDYVNVRDDIKKVSFVLQNTVGFMSECWVSDNIDVQEISNFTNSLADSLVDETEVSDNDSSVFQFFLHSKGVDEERERKQKQREETERRQRKVRQEQEKQRQKRRKIEKRKELVGNIFTFICVILFPIFVFGFALSIGICASDAALLMCFSVICGMLILLLFALFAPVFACVLTILLNILKHFYLK